MRHPGRVEDADACMRPKGCATTISLTQPQNQDISSAPVAYSGRDYWFMSSSALVWFQRSIDERNKQRIRESRWGYNRFTRLYSTYEGHAFTSHNQFQKSLVLFLSSKIGLLFYGSIDLEKTSNVAVKPSKEH